MQLFIVLFTHLSFIILLKPRTIFGYNPLLNFFSILEIRIH